MYLTLLCFCLSVSLTRGTSLRLSVVRLEPNRNVMLVKGPPLVSQPFVVTVPVVEEKLRHVDALYVQNLF